MKINSIIFFLFLLFSGDAFSALVNGKATGVINSALTEGTGNEVFNLDGDSLVGKSFVIDFYYQTDIAPIIESTIFPDDAATRYRSNEKDFDWLGMSLTVNNLTYHSTGNYREAFIIDVFQDSGIVNDDLFNIEVSIRPEMINDFTYRRQIFNISADLSNHVLAESVLPTEFSTNEVSPSSNSAIFSMNYIDFDPITGDLIRSEKVSLDMTIQYIEATVVPIPAAVWLFSSALIGLVSTSYKRKNIFN